MGGRDRYIARENLTFSEQNYDLSSFGNLLNVRRFITGVVVANGNGVSKEELQLVGGKLKVRFYDEKRNVVSEWLPFLRHWIGNTKDNASGSWMLPGVGTRVVVAFFDSGYGVVLGCIPDHQNKTMYSTQEIAEGGNIYVRDSNYQFRWENFLATKDDTEKKPDTLVLSARDPDKKERTEQPVVEMYPSLKKEDKDSMKMTVGKFVISVDGMIQLGEK